MSNATRSKFVEDRLAQIFATLPHCTIEQTSPPVQVVRFISKNRRGKMRTFEGFFKRRGMLDFEGGYMGIHVAIDAKLHESKPMHGKRWNFKSAIADHQIQRLSRVTECGGIAGLILAWVNHEGPIPTQKVYWFGIPAAVLLAALENEIKSWTLEEMKEGARGWGVVSLAPSNVLLKNCVQDFIEIMRLEKGDKNEHL